MARKRLAPTECMRDGLTSVAETGTRTSTTLQSQYEGTSNWLSETFELCRAVLEGIDQPKDQHKIEERGASREESSNLKKILNSSKTISTESEVMALKVEGLKKELKTRGLDTKGRKYLLQKRLLAAIEDTKSPGNKRRKNSKDIPSNGETRETRAEPRPSTIADSNSDNHQFPPETSDVDMEDVREPITDAATTEEAVVEVKDTTMESTSIPKNGNMSSSFEPEPGLSRNIPSGTDSFQNRVLPFTGKPKSTAKEISKSYTSVLPVLNKDKTNKSMHENLTQKNTSSTTALSSVSSNVKSISTGNKNAELTGLEQGDCGAENQETKTMGPVIAPRSTKDDIKGEKRSAGASAKKLLATPALALTTGATMSSGEPSTSCSKGAKQGYADTWKAKAAGFRGKTKPRVEESEKHTGKEMLSVSKLLKTSKPADSSKDKRKVLLAAQMREKAAATLKKQQNAAGNSESAMKTKVKPSTAAAMLRMPQIASSQNRNGKPGIKTQAAHSTLAAAAMLRKQDALSQSKTSKKVKATVVQGTAALFHQTDQVRSTVSAAKVSEEPTSKKEILSPMDTYEISDREESDSDDESDDENSARKNKRIPVWARKSNLERALNEQIFADNRLDPDEIFGEVQSCNLEEIFDQKKSRYSRRTSSGNWTNDRVTIAESLAYKRDMGY